MVKIQHNKKLFWVIIVLIVALIIVIYLIVQKNKVVSGECTKDENCVPATCCHPDSCTSVEKAPLCKGIMCSMVCSGPLDCGAGSCGCIKGKCEVIRKGE